MFFTPSFLNKKMVNNRLNPTNDYLFTLHKTSINDQNKAFSVRLHPVVCRFV